MVRCTSCGPGNRLACISSESEGEDLMAPVMASIADHCIWAIFFAVPMDPHTTELVLAL